MFSSFAELSTLEKVFMVSAIVGGGLFIIHLIIQFLGGDADLDVDVDAGLDADVGFTVLSFQGITSFLAIFGLIGLTCLRDFKTNEGLALTAGTVAGITMMWIIAKLFQFFQSMQSSGSIDIKNALGLTGDVYLRIPSEGIGKVRVKIQHSLNVYDAISEHQEEILSGSQVKVVRITNTNILSVEKI